LRSQLARGSGWRSAWAPASAWISLGIDILVGVGAAGGARIGVRAATSIGTGTSLTAVFTLLADTDGSNPSRHCKSQGPLISAATLKMLRSKIPEGGDAWGKEDGDDHRGIARPPAPPPNCWVEPVAETSPSLVGA
jgi:hypothetical protein